ncbi:hypothetical protein [Gymnodinialimonas ulvae]|uniref:hypothetical protein n=1 Tax=Gymnodinialimonas ulvae TaxID=3126504 RepID=UPI0030A2AE00
MPPLALIALRYLAWLIGLRILYVGLLALTGVPNTPATIVILAAVPAVEIGIYTRRRAAEAIDLGGWVRIWAVMVAVYAVVNVGLPALLMPQFQAAVVAGQGLGNLLIITASAVVMLALFLWIGSRAGGGGGKA